MNGSTLIPCLRYQDARKAIAWLCDTFGFSRQLVVGDGPIIHHAQLTLGTGMVMLGSVQDSDFGKLMRQPEQAGGCTQCVCIIVDDPDAVYAKAKATGAHITTEIADQDYGGRGFGCHDPEGHLWYVGSYDPWNES
jgi:uncharacterized glyoxalase superfamily protein PhnB